MIVLVLGLGYGLVSRLNGSNALGIPQILRIVNLNHNLSAQIEGQSRGAGPAASRQDVSDEVHPGLQICELGYWDGHQGEDTGQTDTAG